jgi:5-formyltetrahydrofolate cyclo-ligase
VHVNDAKQHVRERIWALLERESAVASDVYGRIPAFVGAAQAADRLTELSTWRAAAVIVAVPDRAQLPVRVHALNSGKLVYMAVPKLADDHPFIQLDPERVTIPEERAAASAIASRIGVPIGLDEMRPVDMVICGSVAVNRQGVRLGKGSGYSDIEVAILTEAGLLTTRSPIITTVHDRQIVDEDLPETEHDFSVDYIITPTQVLTCPPPRRPSALRLDLLSPTQLASMPFLRNPHRESRQRD